MNERIRELALQAEIKWQHQEDVIYSTMTSEQFEKVAELIVRECVAICEDTEGDPSADSRWGRRCCALEIREQFGVEE